MKQTRYPMESVASGTVGLATTTAVSLYQREPPVRPADYRQLIDRLASAGAVFDVDRGRPTISGEIPAELGDRLRQDEPEVVANLQAGQRVDVRTAALELWSWLEEGRLEEVDRPVTIHPRVVVLPEQLEFCAR